MPGTRILYLFNQEGVASFAPATITKAGRGDWYHARFAPTATHPEMTLQVLCKKEMKETQWKVAPSILPAGEILVRGNGYFEN